VASSDCGMVRPSAPPNGGSQSTCHALLLHFFRPLADD
jgi:hypothetical protein